MAIINKANRTCCDVDIRVLKTMAPYLFFEDAKVTTFGFTADETFATAKGAKKISFTNPMDATMTIEAQIKPFKLYSLLSDGTVENTAVIAEKQVITASTEATLTLPAGVKAGTVFVYANGDFGGTPIQGSMSGNTFNASEASSIVSGAAYEVGYLVTKSEGVQRISFNNKKNPLDYYCTMKTVEKDELGVITPYIITGYKCKPKKSIDLSFSSEGDAATVKIEFSCLEDKDGNIADMVEYTEPVEI